MSKDVDMVLQPAKQIQPSKQTAPPQPDIKVFCAERKVALSLLEDLIMIAGAHNDVLNGRANEDMIMKLAKNTHVFLVDLGDRLMVDCGLNEHDIENIVKKISADFTRLQIDETKPQ